MEEQHLHLHLHRNYIAPYTHSSSPGTFSEVIVMHLLLTEYDATEISTQFVKTTIFCSDIVNQKLKMEYRAGPKITGDKIRQCLHNSLPKKINDTSPYLTYLCGYIDVYSMSVSQFRLCSFLCNPYITLQIS